MVTYAALALVGSGTPLALAMLSEKQAFAALDMATFMLFGSVTNLIVAEIVSKRGVNLTFGTYLRVGIPITILTLAFGIFWLSLWS